MVRRVTVAGCSCWQRRPSASAQTGSSGTSTGQNQSGTQTSSSAAAEETRPATTTFFGDTGLWFVPTGEVLGHGKWSVSGYRRGTNYIQGYSNVGDFAGTFAVGIKDRAEIFGSFLVDTRIDRDVRPLFISNPDVGGIIDRYPRVNQGWTGDNVGDFYLGAKFNLWSEFRQKPGGGRGARDGEAADGRQGRGRQHRQDRFPVDFIVSKEAAAACRALGVRGLRIPRQPDGFDAPGGAFRWGVGAGFPSRSPPARRGRTERRGAAATMSRRAPAGRVVGVDGSHRRRRCSAIAEPDAGDRRAHLAAPRGLLPRRRG